jgi:hypothetical protein
VAASPAEHPGTAAGVVEREPAAAPTVVTALSVAMLVTAVDSIATDVSVGMGGCGGRVA